MILHPTAVTPAPIAASPGKSLRWIQLALGIVCMAMIANVQYGWTLFVAPMEAKHHWGLAAIQIAFSIFVVVVETWLVPSKAGSSIVSGRAP